MDLPISWGSDQTGRLVFTRDTQRLLVWEGSNWSPVMGRGPLGGAGVDAPMSTTSTAWVTVHTLPVVLYSAVAVMVVASGPSVGNSNGITEVGLFRDSASITQWTQPGRTGSVPFYERPSPLSMVAFDVPGAAGSYNYTLRFRVAADTLGTSVLGATPDAELSLNVIEF